MRTTVKRGRVERIWITLNQTDLIKAAVPKPRAGFVVVSVEVLDDEREDVGHCGPFVQVELVREDLVEAPCEAQEGSDE